MADGQVLLVRRHHRMLEGVRVPTYLLSTVLNLYWADTTLVVAGALLVVVRPQKETGLVYTAEVLT